MAGVRLVSIEKIIHNGKEWACATFNIEGVGKHNISTLVDGRSEAEYLEELGAAANDWREYKMSGKSDSMDIEEWLEWSIREIEKYKKCHNLN